MYQKPQIIVLNVEDLNKYISAAACSTYYCYDQIFNCTIAQFSSSCTFYDQNKCDPWAAPGGIHGN